MAHRAQDRRLGDVAPAERFRLEGFPLAASLALHRLVCERLTVEGGREQGREHGAHAPRDLCTRPRRSVEDEDADAAIAGPQLVGSLPAVLAGGHVELDAGGVGAEQERGARGDRVEAAPHVRTVEQERRRVGCEQRLASLLLRVVGPALRAGGQPADADRSDEVDGEDDPVLGVGEPKRVGRRQEEPVEDEHADDGDRHGVGQAPEGGHRQHREDVQAAEADDRSERVEDEDGTAHDCDGAEAEEAGDEVAAPRRLDQEKPLGAKTAHRRRIGAGPKTPSRFPESDGASR